MAMENPSQRPLRILVLYCNPDIIKETRLTILHHLHALDLIYPRKHILYYNANLVGAPKWIGKLKPDGVILHYSFLAMRFHAPNHFERWQSRIRWLNDLDCVKVAVPQDEYDRSGLLDDWLDELGVSVIFSIFGAETQKVEQIYPKMSHKAAFYSCFTGYIHNGMAERYAQKIRPIAERTTDIIYRARNLPYWFGSLGQMKTVIADVIGARARHRGLHCDISTSPQDAILGETWIDFMASGKATIGSMSGSSVLDPYGQMQSKINAFLKTKPDATFDEVSGVMPAGWDSYHFSALGPRNFEAVLTKTCQLLIEDAYSGVLAANKHYIPIKRDYSNLDEVLEKLKDDRLVQTMVDCAYQDIYLSNRYSYESFGRQLLEVIEQNRGMRAPVAGILWRIGRASNIIAEGRVWLRHYYFKLLLKMIPRPVYKFFKKRLKRM